MPTILVDRHSPMVFSVGRRGEATVHKAYLSPVREVIRMTYAMVYIDCGSYQVLPDTVTTTLDITVDVVHSHQ